MLPLTFETPSTRRDDAHLCFATTRVNAEPFDDTDSLIFYLTTKLTSSEDAEIRQRIEKPMQDFSKSVWYFHWRFDEDGDMNDVAQIAYNAVVKGIPKWSRCLLFIDQAATRDNRVLVVQTQPFDVPNEDFPNHASIKAGEIVTYGRLSAEKGPCAVVNVALANMDLIEYFNEGSPMEWNGHLLHHLQAEREEEMEDPQDLANSLDSV